MLAAIAITSVAATSPITTVLTVQKVYATCGFLDVCQVRIRILIHVHVIQIEDNNQTPLFIDDQSAYMSEVHIQAKYDH